MNSFSFFMSKIDIGNKNVKDGMILIARIIPDQSIVSNLSANIFLFISNSENTIFFINLQLMLI